MDLMQLLQSQLGGDAVQQLGQQIGVQDTDKVEDASEGIMQLLVSGLAQNAATPQGAQAISTALNNDHDGSLLQDLMGVLGGASQHPQANNGAGILGHILGNRQEVAAQQLGQATGLSAGNIMSMMIKMAPLVMGVLGQAQRQNGLDASGLSSILSGAVQQQAQNPAMGMIGKLLDRNGDGNMMDDVAQIGMGLLGKFFKR